MEAHGKITAVFEPVAEGGYVAYIEEIPGINTQGETLDEARENLREALELVLEVRREVAEEELAGRSVIRESIQLVA
jgi:predicted RNase H-like HicB family nuclease